MAAARRHVHARVRRRSGGDVQPEHRRAPRPDDGADRRRCGSCCRSAASARATRSSIGFRAGAVDAHGKVSVDEPEPFPTLGSMQAGLFDRAPSTPGSTRWGTTVRARRTSSISSAPRSPPTDLEGASRSSRASATPGATLGRRRRPDPGHHIVLVPHRLRRRDPPLRARPVAVDAGRSRHGMEDARFVRFVDDDGATDVPRDLHGVRRRLHQPAAPADRRLRHVHDGADGGSGRCQQGPGDLPPEDRWPARGDVPARSGDQRRGVLRTRSATGTRPSPARCRSRAGTSSRSATAARRSRPTPVGCVLTHGVGPMRTSGRN